MANTYIEVSDQINRTWQIYDAANHKWSSNIYGYYQDSFNLNRNWQYAWRDFALNNLLTVKESPDSIKWQGRIEAIELNYSKKKPYVTVSSTGYQSHLSDMFYHGTLPSGSWESQLTALYLLNLMPYIVGDASKIYPSGMTNGIYYTGNGGTDDESVFTIINNILDGNLSDGSKIQLQIWANRVMQTIRIYPRNIATATYEIELNNIESMSLRRSLLSVENQVRTRYKDINGIVQYYDTPVDSSSALALGKQFASGFINYVRMHIQDITGLKNQSATSAQNAASKLLSETKVLRNDSKAITLVKNAKVKEVATNRYIDASDMTTGQYVKVVNLFPRSKYIGSGTAAGDAALMDKFLITKIDCDDTGKVTLTPEQSSKLDDVVQ